MVALAVVEFINSSFRIIDNAELSAINELPDFVALFCWPLVVDALHLNVFSLRKIAFLLALFLHLGGTETMAFTLVYYNSRTFCHDEMVKT